ncbi:MAG: N-acetylmuramoyl-L-alanine amidase [Gemmatimonadetes bacterium]|nr:N-acetylmuramoyl-L-alanine amidase [Gemmatimonadota bacterium]
MEINRTLRLPPSEYFPAKQEKSGIAIHHTVCRNARTAFESWNRDQGADGATSHVATAYLIDQDGAVFEIFDPAAWAWQFGLTWPDPARTDFEKRFIGVELASEGPLTERDGQLYAFGRITPQDLRPKTQAFDCGRDYRGYHWFTRYQPAQLVSLATLIGELCGRFDIPRVYPDSPFDYYGERLGSFAGVIGHAMVRPDKSDPSPSPEMWEIIGDQAGLTPTAMAPSGPSGPARPGADLDQLTTENLRLINSMATAAGSLVKNFLMELARRGTWLRLSSPTAYSVAYEVAEGARGQLSAVASALGLRVTDRTVEVRHE